MFDGYDDSDTGPWALAVLISLGLVLAGMLGWLVVLLWMDRFGRWFVLAFIAFGLLVCLVRVMIWWTQKSRRWLQRRLARSQR